MFEKYSLPKLESLYAGHLRICFQNVRFKMMEILKRFSISFNSGFNLSLFNIETIHFHSSPEN